MSACLDKDTSVITADVSPDSCVGYVLITNTEYKLLSSPLAEFDSDIFTQIIIWFLITFVAAFAGGFISKKLGK